MKLLETATILRFIDAIALKAGVVMPGYLSTSADLKFSDVPVGCFASLEAVPTAGWLQIMVLTCMQETGQGFASQTDDAEAGDIAHDSCLGAFALGVGAGRLLSGFSSARV